MSSQKNCCFILLSQLRSHVATHSHTHSEHSHAASTVSHSTSASITSPLYTLSPGAALSPLYTLSPPCILLPCASYIERSTRTTMFAEKIL
jgi:hypothetical protein